MMNTTLHLGGKETRGNERRFQQEETKWSKGSNYRRIIMS